MSATLTLGAALLLGLAASGHCLLMCGGITAALGIATAKNPAGRPRTVLLVSYQAGRIASYSLAGLLLGGLAGGFVALLDIELVRRVLRVLSGIAILLAALVVSGQLRDPGSRIGNRLWARLAPLARRLLPIATVPRALAFGAVWGWMPCGFVYSVLVIATLQADAAHGALVMAAFGLGTLPSMFAASLGAGRVVALAARPTARRVGGALLLVCAILTLAGPWLMSGRHLPDHGQHPSAATAP